MLSIAFNLFLKFHNYSYLGQAHHPSGWGAFPWMQLITATGWEQRLAQLNVSHSTSSSSSKWKKSAPF